MRIKSALIFFSLAILLSGCFAKKKRSYAKSKRSYENAQTQRGAAQWNAPSTNGFTSYTFSSAEEYISTFAPIAVEEMEAYGIPASITLAQGLLESGAGKSSLVRKSNNHFGIKCHTQWRGPSTTHDDDKKGECFRKYLHPRESYRDHSLFLANGKRYAFLFELRKTDYRAWARGLKKAGYATDPKYPSKLIAQIKKYRLDRYDRASKAKRMIKESRKTAVNVLKTGAQSVQKAPMNQKASLNQTPRALKGSTHTVQKGDTLYGISKKYGISVTQLKKINGLRTNDIQVGIRLKISTN